MALTQQETAWRIQYMRAYGGQLPGVAQDQEKFDAMLSGSETTQKALLKEFVQDILLPAHETELPRLEASIEALEGVIATEQAYVDA